MPKLANALIIAMLFVAVLGGCDLISGGQGNQPAPTVAVQPVQPVQPVTVPAPQATLPAAAQPIQAVQAPTAVAPTPPAPTGDVLIDKLAARKFALAQEFSATSTLTKGTLEKNKTQAYQVQLPGPPYCHTFIAVADDTAKNIDLALTSPSGTAEAADSTVESSAMIQNHCPTVSGPYKLAVAMPSGSGEFAVQVFSK